MVDWQSAQKKAAKTARWAITLTKVRISKTISRTAWQLVTFNGPNGGESVGIVDLLAIRKRHKSTLPNLKRGDLLEIILIQVKGGSARFPTTDELHRLCNVARMHRAKMVLLVQWTRERQVRFFRLKRTYSTCNGLSGSLAGIGFDSRGGSLAPTTSQQAPSHSRFRPRYFPSPMLRKHNFAQSNVVGRYFD
jgi:hypothetical protein